MHSYSRIGLSRKKREYAHRVKANTISLPSTASEIQSTLQTLTFDVYKKILETYFIDFFVPGEIQKEEIPVSDNRTSSSAVNGIDRKEYERIKALYGEQIAEEYLMEREQSVHTPRRRFVKTSAEDDTSLTIRKKMGQRPQVRYIVVRDPVQEHLFYSLVPDLAEILNTLMPLLEIIGSLKRKQGLSAEAVYTYLLNMYNGLTNTFGIKLTNTPRYVLPIELSLSFFYLIFTDLNKVENSSLLEEEPEPVYAYLYKYTQAMDKIWSELSNEIYKPTDLFGGEIPVFLQWFNSVSGPGIIPHFWHAIGSYIPLFLNCCPEWIAERIDEYLEVYQHFKPFDRYIPTSTLVMIRGNVPVKELEKYVYI